MRGCRRYARGIASAGAVLIAFGALTVTPTTVQSVTQALLTYSGLTALQVQDPLGFNNLIVTGTSVPTTITAISPISRREKGILA